MYSWIKDNCNTECIHANKTYQEFEDTITVYFEHVAYKVKHRSIEYFIYTGEDNTQEIFISKNIWDETNWDYFEDIYYYKYHNWSIDWIDLVVNAIENETRYQDDYTPSEDF